MWIKSQKAVDNFSKVCIEFPAFVENQAKNAANSLKTVDNWLKAVDNSCDFCGKPVRFCGK